MVSVTHLQSFTAFNLKVGFTAAHLVDKGTTAVIRAGRVHKDFEGRKLFKRLAQSVGGLAVQKGAKVVLSAFTPSMSSKESPEPEHRYRRISDLVRVVQPKLEKTYLLTCATNKAKTSLRIRAV